MENKEIFQINNGISQETLKAIACLTMLLDHVGALFVRGFTLRIIGRIAFPIYCFLMAEGAYYTKNPVKYGIRLFIGMLLAEVPFDLAFYNRFTWAHQSVMVTLLIGFIAIELIQWTDNDILKLLVTFAGYGLAEWANTDYGGYGVLLVILFSQSRGRLWIQSLLLLMVCWLMNSLRISVFGFRVPIEMFAIIAMVPIAFYRGKKATKSKAVQTVFYLFYPVHLAVLVIIRAVLKG